ncbi:VCBS domain-containing protein, partial [Endozoicomonas sp.]|nr:VCBS domain-containing protein [Endozoicomonas sp.]
DITLEDKTDTHLEIEEEYIKESEPNAFNSGGNTGYSDDQEIDEKNITFHFMPQPADPELVDASEATDEPVEEEPEVDTFSYEDLASKLTSNEDGESLDIDLDQIISEVDQAISEADRLMDSTLGIHDTKDKPSTELGLLTDDNNSPEHALTDLIENLPEDSSQEDSEKRHEAEEDLEELIERLPYEDSETENNEEEEEEESASEYEYVTDRPEILTTPEPLVDQKMFINGSTGYIFDLVDFDPSRQGLNRIRIDELPSNGVLLYNKQPAEPGQQVNKNELLTGRLSFTPDSTENIFDNTEFGYSICFGHQNFEPITSCDLSVTIDISANTEDALVGSGDIAIVANGEAAADFIAGTIVGEYGELTINTNGYWVYEADRAQPAFKHLTKDSKLTEILSLSTEDEQSYTIAFYIIGPFEKTKLITTS